MKISTSALNLFYIYNNCNFLVCLFMQEFFLGQEIPKGVGRVLQTMGLPYFSFPISFQTLGCCRIWSLLPSQVVSHKR